MTRRPLILFACTGLGRIPRGMESHIDGLFRKFSGMSGFEIVLARGGGPSETKVWRMPNIHRESRTAYLLERLGINRYRTENFTFFTSLAFKLFFRKVDVIYLGDFPLYNLLFKWRAWLRKSYSLVFFTGGQVVPGNFDTARDFLHHVTPEYLGVASGMGIPDNRQAVIPHFIDLPGDELVSPEEKAAIRQRLNLPAGKQVILSVGLISAIKGMDFLISETAQLPENWFLLLVGGKDHDTQAILEKAGQELGSSRFKWVIVGRAEVWDYYKAADVFVLASQKESFGLVLAEALAAGLPVIVSDFPAAYYVTGGHAIIHDLSQPGSFVHALQQVSTDPAAAEARRHYARKRFSWEAVQQQYLDIFNTVTT